MKRLALFFLFLVAAVAPLQVFSASAALPLARLLDRISPRLSEKIIIELTGDTIVDSYAIVQAGDKPMVIANNMISAAVGVHRYLRRFAGVNLSWDCMTATLPDTLPPVTEVIAENTSMRRRYYLNYCTHSYSMAFWDEARWRREVDWMALNGVNLPLAITGTEAVWRNVLLRLGYSADEARDFIAGPGFQAWWLMNNLEGWGGPVSDSHIDAQARLQTVVLGYMRELGMEPVFAGYCGMLPHDAGSRLGVKVSDPGKWLGYTRPVFLMPTDTAFSRVAAIYYDELTRLYGNARYYSADPFHEGGDMSGVDIAAAGRAILQAMRRATPGAVWVVQAWQENPNARMVAAMPFGSMLLLDLQAENCPMWKQRPELFSHQPWLYCMLLNFGGNVGLYGKSTALVAGFDSARRESLMLDGIGMTMEGIGNNAIMWQLFCDMPWQKIGAADVEAWTAEYVRGRYGRNARHEAVKAWQILMNSILNCPADSMPQGARESVFCAPPADNVDNVSSWANASAYYSPDSVIVAARLMAAAASTHAANPRFVYDFIDIARQAIAECGRKELRKVGEAASHGDSAAYRRHADEFIRLAMLQDSMLNLHPDFRFDSWLCAARAADSVAADKALAEWNARVQVTVWGFREASEKGGLRDYSHREWSGLLRDYYIPRWQRYFDLRLANWHEKLVIDRYAEDEPWTRRQGGFNDVSPAPDNAAELTREFLEKAIGG